MLILLAFLIVLPTLCVCEAAKKDVVLEIKAMMNINMTVQESFLTNIVDDTIIVQFQLDNGFICYTVYDFQNGIKVFKVDVLGEPELGQKQYQSICFVTVLKKDEIIPADAMAKLRQKSSGSVQEANDVLQTRELNTDIELINIAGSRNVLGEKFHRLCSGRESLVYAKESELSSLAKGDAETLANLKTHLSRPPSSENLMECSLKTTLSAKFQPCVCKIPFTIPWYPCVIKYCSSKNQQGHTTTTRCGIRSCRVTHHLNFVANHPLSCHWGVT